MRNLTRVKCKLCGKIGLKKQPKALRRHLHLSHNIFTSNTDEYYEITDSDSVINILESKREFRKSMGGGGGRRSGAKNYIKMTSSKIIYTPMGNKR